MKKFGISIIIPAYNEEHYIGPCLESLVWQKTKHKFEVVVANNNSTDDTKKIALSFKAKLNIRVVDEKQPGRGAARWRGFEEATGDFLFSTDADTIVPPNWIESFMKYFKNKKIVAVTSMCNIDDPSKSNKAIFKFVHRLTTEGSRIALGHYCLYGFSYAIRRDIYLKAGKINKSLNALDDLDLGQRAKKYGKIQLVRDMPVLASSRRFKDGMFKGLISFVGPVLQVVMKNNKFRMTDHR
ncbi:MAG: putative glycosyltransferase [Candidatus Levybacteria bacterium]|nr:putative glycosyltransferase [Candidatus Levybacteria bacterium]